EIGERPGRERSRSLARAAAALVGRPDRPEHPNRRFEFRVGCRAERRQLPERSQQRHQANEADELAGVLERDRAFAVGRLGQREQFVIRAHGPFQPGASPLAVVRLGALRIGPAGLEVEDVAGFEIRHGQAANAQTLRSQLGDIQTHEDDYGAVGGAASDCRHWLPAMREAMITACVRLSTPSFCRMADTWALMVASETPSSYAICLFNSP